VSPALAIVAAAQALYVADSVYCEECILTTMDIIQDGFGFMLAFGDLAWVPFMYSLQARFLVDKPQAHSPGFLALCVAVCATGFAIFRAANAQKDAWKKDSKAPQFAGACARRASCCARALARPTGRAGEGPVAGPANARHARPPPPARSPPPPNGAPRAGMPFVPSPTGSKLLAGGWWGVSRHINYFGDWLLALGMSLPTGAWLRACVVACVRARRPRCSRHGSTRRLRPRNYAAPLATQPCRAPTLLAHFAPPLQAS